MGSPLWNRPPCTPRMLQQEWHKGRLIQKKPLLKCLPADKVHYIVRCRDWRLTHSVTLALDVPKTGTLGSGEFNNRRLLAFQPPPSFQSLSERESSTSWSWIGRTAPWRSLLRNKTIRISRSTGMCIIHIGDPSIEKIRWPETKRNGCCYLLQ